MSYFSIIEMILTVYRQESRFGARRLDERELGVWLYLGMRDVGEVDIVARGRGGRGRGDRGRR